MYLSTFRRFILAPWHTLYWFVANKIKYSITKLSYPLNGHMAMENRDNFLISPPQSIFAMRPFRNGTSPHLSAGWHSFLATLTWFQSQCNVTQHYNIQTTLQYSHNNNNESTLCTACTFVTFSTCNGLKYDNILFCSGCL